MKQSIGIVAWGSASALGHEPGAIWQAYQRSAAAIQRRNGTWVAPLAEATEVRLRELRNSDKSYRRLDRSVLLAMLAAEQTLQTADWTSGTDFGLYLGSSRGASSSWEAYFQQFQEKADRLSPLSSPLTTSGNLATQTARHLSAYGYTSDNSITCSTALHALANAVAWLESGRYQRFVAGGTEAPLTPFTIAQLRALQIYSKTGAPYPCRALDLDKTENTLVLGEGSALFALEVNAPKPIARIAGLGYAREDASSPTAVSPNGQALQNAMRQALSEAGLTTVDTIVCHAPGTRLGDWSEWQAIQRVFDKNIPSLTSNKWKLGHSLGASGGLSLELALLLIQHQVFPPIPYLAPTPPPRKIRTVMVNALGFGGNAVSLIITKP